MTARQEFTTAQILQKTPIPKTQWKHQIFIKTSILLKQIEKTILPFTTIKNTYGKLFYKTTVKKELEMAKLKENSKVLVVGCGHQPHTGLYLAKQGYDVHCIDIDPAAINSNQTKTFNTKGKINFKNIDGRNMNYQKYDAVWVTFSVSQKHEILTKILKEIKENGKIIYRNPRGHFKKIYPWINPNTLLKNFKAIIKSLGSHSILLVKNKTTLEPKEKTILNELQTGTTATIVSCPNDSCLQALGLRPGKTIKLALKQPFGGPLLVSVDNRNFAIDKEIAALTFVS